LTCIVRLSYTEDVLRRSLLALAAMALVLGLAACGGVSDPLSPLAAAADRSAGAGGVKMHMDATFTAAGQSASMSADGLFDGDEGELTMNLGDLLGQSGLGGDGAMTVIVAKDGDHPVMYVRAPDLATMLGGGKSWMKVDLEQAMSTLGGGKAKDLFGVTGQSPADALALLRKVGSVTEVGGETVDGVKTTHYRATVDLADALENGGAPAEALAAVRASGVATKVPVDVWVGDDDGYVHKLRITYGTAAGGQSFGGELTMTLTDWGTDVSIDVPSDDETFDATQLLAGLGAKP
jgi:hypothetical protein